MTEHSLHSNELLCLSGAAGSEIRVRSGVLWLTEAEQPGDVILHPGQTYRVRGGGLLVCEPLTGSARLLVRRNRWRLAVRLLRLLAAGMRRGNVRRVAPALGVSQAADISNFHVYCLINSAASLQRFTLLLTIG